MTGLKARLIAYNDWQEADQATWLARQGRHAGTARPREPATPPKPSALAARIARAIESSVRFPAGHDGTVCVSVHCEHCVRYRTAQAFAAMARRIGGAQ